MQRNLECGGWAKGSVRGKWVGGTQDEAHIAGLNQVVSPSKQGTTDIIRKVVDDVLGECQGREQAVNANTTGDVQSEAEY